MSTSLLLAVFAALPLVSAQANGAPAPSARAQISVTGTNIDLAGAKVHRSTREAGWRWTTPPRTVTVEARGLTIKIPSSVFGRGLGKAIANTTDARQRDILMSAAAQAKQLGDFSEADARAAKQSHRYERDKSLSALAEILGLPHRTFKADPVDANDFASVPVPGRAASGPLTASKIHAGVVEGSWTVGKSNGSQLRALVSYLMKTQRNTKGLRRGDRVGLRASRAEDGRDIDVTLFPGGESTQPVHMRITQDEDGLEAYQSRADHGPESHKGPLAP